MTRTDYPRPDFIAELTEGLQLPLEPIHSGYLRIIAAGLADAWEGLGRHHAEVLARGSEDEVNALMETRLLAMRDEDLIWAQLVDNVVRGRETINFDGRRLETRPDLSIFLSGRAVRFPLIVECKLIDQANGKGPDLYCGKGLVRFIEGDYAWASREGFMLAYVRDGASIVSSLLPFLTANSTSFQTEALPSSIRCGALDLAISRHERRFVYCGKPQGEVPGSIVLWHLWLPMV